MPFLVRPASRVGSLLELAAGSKGASVLVMSAALTLVATTASAQSVGVTSATVGGPLGKPPAEVERVLHVGVDVKANELITTGAADRAHLVFLDGTALSVGPEARLVIDSFVYDANHKLGELSLSATRGVFRFVGGNISKAKAVTITTPSSAITIRGGIMMVAVDPAETKATFLYGQAMTVTGHGRTQVVTRPGWGVRTVGGYSPEQAMPIAHGALAGQMAMLEGPGGRSAGPGSGPSGGPGGGQGGPKPQMSRGQPDMRSAAQGPTTGSPMGGALNGQATASASVGVKQSEPVDEAISGSGLADINSGRGLHGQGGPASGQGRGDGPAKVGPPPPDGAAANRPLLPDSMGLNGPLPSGLPPRQ
jgi:hypothetical protein